MDAVAFGRIRVVAAVTAVEQASREFVNAANRLPSLFDLEDEAYRLLALLEDADNPPEDCIAEVANQLALVDSMLMEKTESYVSVIRSLEAMSAARKAEADRLRDRAASASRHAEWLRNRLLTHMKVTERDRIETARFSLSIKLNPPRVEVLEAAMVPSEYQRTKIEISVDKAAILAAYKKDGLLVPGVEIQRGERLSIA